MTEINYSEFGYRGNGEAEDVMRWALDKLDSDIVLACSFQHPVLIHMASEIRGDLRVVAVDTGRLPEETYQCAAQIERKYKIKINWYFPDSGDLHKLVRENGQFSFKDSMDARKRCCWIRKISPMNRALKEAKGWITGIRRDQASSRESIPKISIDEAHGGILKICPIADWSERRVRDYIKEHHLPYNRLMESGYRSIGCACCTRAVQSGEEPRAGRWWWENSENKECGLHIPNWTI